MCVCVCVCVASMQGWEKVPLNGDESVRAREVGSSSSTGSVLRDMCKFLGMIALGTSIGMLFVYLRWKLGLEELVH